MMASSSSEDFNIFEALSSQPDLLELVVQQCSGNKNNLRLACSRLRAAVDAFVTSLAWTATPESLADFTKGGKKAQNMEFLSRCPRLQALDFNGRRVADLSPLAGCISLRKVTGVRAYCYASGGSLAPLAALTHLEHLQFESTGSPDFNFSELAALTACTALKDLDCSRTWITQLPPLPASLETLFCSRTPLTDISALTACSALKHLDCSDSSSVISILPPLPASLETLKISGTTHCADLSPLAACPGLRSLDCSHTPVQDLAPLAACTRLRSLDCRRTTVRNLLPLLACTQLEVLECSHFGGIAYQTNQLLQVIPGLIVHECHISGMWGEFMDEDEANEECGYGADDGMENLGWDDDSGWFRYLYG